MGGWGQEKYNVIQKGHMGELSKGHASGIVLPHDEFGHLHYHNIHSAFGS